MMNDNDDRAPEFTIKACERTPEDLNKLPDAKLSDDQRAVERTEFSNVLNKMIAGIDMKRGIRNS